MQLCLRGIIKQRKTTTTDCIISIFVLHYYIIYVCRMLEFRWENWMVVGVLTPCLIALYLMIMMVAYHMFCKKQHPEANAVHNIQPTQYLEVVYILGPNRLLR